jgi:hypothetical protein
MKKYLFQLSLEFASAGVFFWQGFEKEYLTLLEILHKIQDKHSHFFIFTASHIPFMNITYKGWHWVNLLSCYLALDVEFFLFLDIIFVVKNTFMF